MRDKAPINDFQMTRRGRKFPHISSPIPITDSESHPFPNIEHHPRSASPPDRPSRPTSLSPSFMEDMRTMPQPRSMNNPLSSKEKSVAIWEVPNHVRDDSPSPPPLRVYKSRPIISPFGPDLERNARASPVDYTFDDDSITEPSITEPRRSLYSSPELARYRLGPNGPYLPEPLDSVEVQNQRIMDDPPVRRVHHAEALRRLEEVQGSNMNTVDETEDDEVKSEGSYDFAAARAQKLLADKRKRGL